MWSSSDIAFAWPRLTQLVSQSTLLTRHYVQPLCTPTRSAFLSGRHPFQDGMQHGTFIASQEYVMPLHLETIASRLRQEGYATAMVGKWHVGSFTARHTPPSRGFDYFFGFYDRSGDHYSPTTTMHDRDPTSNKSVPLEVLDLHEQTAAQHTAVRLPEQSARYSAQLFCAKAQTVVYAHARRNQTRPLFLYCALQNVHGPLQAPDSYVSRCRRVGEPRRQLLCAMAAAADDAIGNVTHAVEQAFAGHEYLMVITSDDGAPLNRGGSNFPLRGYKSSLLEGGVRSHALAWGTLLPQRARGRSFGGLVWVGDWHAAFAALGGVSNVSSLDIDGVSVWESLIGSTCASARTSLLLNFDSCPRGFWDPPECPTACRSAPENGSLFCLERRAIGCGCPGASQYSFISGDLKLLVNPGDPLGGVLAPAQQDDVQLYNLSADPSEQHDLASQAPADVAALTATAHDVLLHGYRETCNFPGGSCYDFSTTVLDTCRAHGDVWWPWSAEAGLRS